MMAVLNRGRYSVSRGFSLLEILVVASIISVLAALLLMGYQSAVNASYSATCSNRLRHIYAATQAYVADYNGLMYPDLGPRTIVHPDYSWQQWWWNQAYLGRYVLGQLDRRRDMGGGAMNQEEAEYFNCPARFVDGPDSMYTQANGTSAVSYIMRRQAGPLDFQFHNVDEHSRQVLITEGRGVIVPKLYARTGVEKDATRQLRRYHNGALNILFYDGRVERFSGEDEILQREYWNPLRP